MSKYTNVAAKHSMVNYVPSLSCRSAASELESDINEETVTSFSSDQGFNFEEYSKTFETVKVLAEEWTTHRFDYEPWDDNYRPYLQLQDNLLVTDEETENRGVLTDTVIGSSLSYLERSPEDSHHVLCKCVLTSKQLNDISEIRYYHYIQYLDLSWNELTTLAPLGQLPFLQYLDVSHNFLEKLLDFKAPFYLTYVNFSYNQVGVIPDLRLFWSITHLDLSFNRIVQIAGIQNLRFLSYLDLSYNEIKKLENLNDLRLQSLNLHHNNIADSKEDGTVAFKTLLYIRHINLSHNKLTSLKIFEDTGNLESVDLSNNKIFNLLEISYFQGLRYLSRVNLLNNPVMTVKYYFVVCLSWIKNLMTLDEKEITAEQRIEAKKSCEIAPSLPARESRIDLMLLQQINQPYIGPFIVPYDQPPPMVIILVGPPGSMKKDIMYQFAQINENLICGVSHTTRPKLISEIEGKDYYFVSDEEFKTIVRKGRFIAVSEFNGHSYGIVHDELRKCLDKVLLFHSDLNTALSLRIMGVNPTLVLAMPREESIHTTWLHVKYYYDFVVNGIIRIKTCPQCSRDASSTTNQDSLYTDIYDILKNIIRKAIESDESSWGTTDNVVRFQTPQDLEESNSKLTMSSILKRKVSDSTDDYTQTNNEEFSDSQPMRDSYNKRVSFNDIPDMDYDNEVNYKYRSISEALVARDQANMSKPLLSTLSTETAIIPASLFSDVSTESSESYIMQSKIDEFIVKIMDSRNDLLEIHWSNPGLFSDTIFTENVEESLCKLKWILKRTIENRKLSSPTLSLDNDRAFKNIINARLTELDLQEILEEKNVNAEKNKGYVDIWKTFLFFAGINFLATIIKTLLKQCVSIEDS